MEIGKRQTQQFREERKIGDAEERQGREVERRKVRGSMKYRCKKEK